MRIDLAVELRRGALVEGREAQHRPLADMDLVDLVRRDLGLDDQARRRRARPASATSPAWITPPIVCTAPLEDLAVLRRDAGRCA